MRWTLEASTINGYFNAIKKVAYWSRKDNTQIFRIIEHISLSYDGFAKTYSFAGGDGASLSYGRAHIFIQKTIQSVNILSSAINNQLKTLNYFIMRGRRNARIKVIANPAIDFPKENRWPPKMADVLVILLAALTLWVAYYEGSTSGLQNKEIQSIGTEIKQMNEQIGYLSKIATNQEKEIGNQNGQLKELQSANLRLQTQGKDIAKETHAVSEQLEIGEKQQAESLKLAFLTKKMYVTRLMNTVIQIIYLSPNFELEDINVSNEEHLKFLTGIKELLEKELNNYVILENDSLSSYWLRSYDLLESAVQLLQWSSRAKPLSDPTYPGMSTEINHTQFTSTFFEWKKSLGIIMDIIGRDYKEYLPKENG